MHREIGSEFHITEKNNIILDRNLSIIQKSYHDYVYARSGREAIGFILDEIEPCTRIAVLPAYICKSMLEPFLKRGYSVEYFSIDQNFNPDLKEIEIALNKNPDVMLVIDWFGMNKNQEVISLVKKRFPNLVTLADCTHNFFNDFMTIEADFVIASLRKWFALPDGAIAINCRNDFKNRLKFVDSCFFNKRKKAMLLKAEYLNSREQSLKMQYRKLLSAAEHFLDSESMPVGISAFSLSLINEMDFNFMKMKRRENFNALYDLIDGFASTPIINRTITSAECPFCFPIIVENNRNKLQEWLAENGIYCPVLWPLPDYVYLNYEASAYLSDNMLSIPCDQRYSVDDMEYIAKTIKAFFWRS